jgi:hypothetical protein
MTTDPRRRLVVAEAETWIGTPCYHMGQVKCAGTDCLMMLAEVYETSGIIPHLELLNIQMPRRLWQSSCTHIFGDSMCQFNRSSLALTFTATAGSSQTRSTARRSRRRHLCSAPSPAKPGRTLVTAAPSMVSKRGSNVSVKLALFFPSPSRYLSDLAGL